MLWTETQQSFEFCQTDSDVIWDPTNYQRCKLRLSKVLIFVRLPVPWTETQQGFEFCWIKSAWRFWVSSTSALKWKHNKDGNQYNLDEFFAVGVFVQYTWLRMENSFLCSKPFDECLI